MPSFADIANSVKQRQSQDTGAGMRTIAPRSASSNAISARLSTPQAQKLISDAGSSADPDGAKYQLAVDFTTDILGSQDTSDPLFKETLDETFAQMKPSDGVTGEQMRDENIAIKAGQGINEFNNMIGNGMDWVFDNTLGNVAQAIGGDQWGDTVKNWFDGRDASVVPDMVEDIALAAIPYAGIPLVATKNGLQQSKNITDAMTGRDSVTNRRIDDNQRAGKIGSAALTTALSAVPGVGVARATAKGADKGFKELASGLAKDAGETAKNVGSNVANAVPHPVQTAKNVAKSTGNMIKNRWTDLSPDNNSVIGNLAERVRQNHPALATGIKGTGELLYPGLVELGTGLGSATANAALAYQGANGGTIDQAFAQYFQDFMNGNAPNPFVAMMPLGAGVMSRKMLPTLRGNYQQQGRTMSKLPFYAQRAAALGNLVSQGASNDVNQPSFVNLPSNSNNEENDNA